MALIKKLKKPVLRDRHRRIFALIKENRFRLFLAMLCMLVIAVATSATAFLVKPVLDDIFFNKEFLIKVWNQHQTGLRDWSFLLWIVMMFNFWYKRFIESD